MKLSKWFMFTLAAITFSGLFASPAKADGWVNGFWVYPYKYVFHDQIGGRPFSPQQAAAGLQVHDAQVNNIPFMHKGIAVGPTAVAPYVWWTWRYVAIWHCEVSGVRRTPGGHVDFCRIVGAGDQQSGPTTVICSDLVLHDGDGLPLIVQDGKYDSILFKDIRIFNTNIGAQVVNNSGHVNTVTVDHCPGMQLLLLGKPGGIDTVYVKNSPYIRIWDNPATPWRKTGAKIIYLN